MERDCESELSKLNIEQNACIYHFGASVIHGQRSNILRLPYSYQKDAYVKAVVWFLKKYLEQIEWKLSQEAFWEYLELLLNLGKKKGIEVAAIKEWLIKTEVENVYNSEGTHGNC